MGSLAWLKPMSWITKTSKSPSSFFCHKNINILWKKVFFITLLWALKLCSQKYFWVSFFQVCFWASFVAFGQLRFFFIFGDLLKIFWVFSLSLCPLNHSKCLFLRFPYVLGNPKRPWSLDFLGFHNNEMHLWVTRAIVPSSLSSLGLAHARIWKHNTVYVGGVQYFFTTVLTTVLSLWAIRSS